MNLKTLLNERIERENKYLSEQEVGSGEYNASMERLNTLGDKLADLEKFEAESARKDKQMDEEKKDRLIKNITEGVKIVTGVVVPMVGLIIVTAFEKNDTFTSAARGIVNCFIPKKGF